jgi:hypothetical protein
MPSQGFESVQQAYREAALSLSYTSPSRPILSLDDLSSLECALIGATAATKTIIASKGNNLRAIPDEDLAVAISTIRAFANADLNVTKDGRTDVRPPQHRALPTPANRYEERSRPPHLHKPRRPDLHPRHHHQREHQPEAGLS